MTLLFFLKSTRNRLLKKIVLFCFIVICNIKTYAQSGDTLRTDSLVIKKEIVLHSPSKAALLSTVLPGLGQGYNKKYWKMPVIYGGFIGLAYSFNFNHSRYIKYRDAYKSRIEGYSDNYVNIYSNEDLFYLQKTYHRFRDLTVIGATLLYVFNIIDATVDAHMFTFDVSADLTLNIHPVIINSVYLKPNTTGLSINLKF